MRGCRWLSIGTIGLGTWLLAGCLRATFPPQARLPRSPISTAPAIDAREEAGPPPPPSDYLVSRTPAVPPLDDQPALRQTQRSIAESEERSAEAEKPVEPVDVGAPSSEPPSPDPPADAPQPREEASSAPLSSPEAPSVQVLRAVLDNHPEEEINEQLQSFDPITRQALLVLLTSVARLQQDGGVERMSPPDLAAWIDRLNTLTAALRGRAQLILERMCFCRSIKNFGDYAPLPPEHAFFQPGEVAHIYVQVRNISSRRVQDKYMTVLKGRFEIYNESNRDKPPITWVSPPCEDISASPRQDYYINFRFPVPRNCPPGLYTIRIRVEDWTDALPGAEQVPKGRIAQRTLDFRVGGPLARPARRQIAESAPPP